MARDEDESGRSPATRPTPATLLRLACAGQDDEGPEGGGGPALFHTPDGEPYATFAVRDHWETWRLRSPDFRLWLSRCCYEATGRAATAKEMREALNTLEGQALFDGEEHAVHVRLAEHQRSLYLDLGDAEWRTVRITARGWQVERQSPVKFRRAKGMRPLPEPVRGGNVVDLYPFLNVNAAERVLVVAWLLAALRPRGPYPVLVLYGEQGSAKSTAAEVLRSLVDPNSAPLRAEPRSVRDLMIAAANGWMFTLENLSQIAPWLSDALCRLSTGGGFATRSKREREAFGLPSPADSDTTRTLAGGRGARRGASRRACRSFDRPQEVRP